MNIPLPLPILLFGRLYPSIYSFLVDLGHIEIYMLSVDVVDNNIVVTDTIVIYVLVGDVVVVLVIIAYIFILLAVVAMVVMVIMLIYQYIDLMLNCCFISIY